MPLLLRTLAVFAAGFMLVGCETASLDSYVDPAYSAKDIRKVVVLPMTNAGITPGQAQELSRSFAQGMLRTNPTLEIMGAGEAIDKINAANLAVADNLHHLALGRSVEAIKPFTARRNGDLARSDPESVNVLHR
jgi:hypothetical protein